MERFISKLDMLKLLSGSELPVTINTSNAVANATVTVVRAFQRQLERANRLEAELVKTKAMVERLIETTPGIIYIVDNWQGGNAIADSEQYQHWKALVAEHKETK